MNLFPLPLYRMSYVRDAAEAAPDEKAATATNAAGVLHRRSEEPRSNRAQAPTVDSIDR